MTYIEIDLSDLTKNSKDPNINKSVESTSLPDQTKTELLGETSSENTPENENIDSEDK